MEAKEALENYPIQFRDKIDEYLWKEHHILGGCCSSVESMRYAVAREIAEKLTDAFIEEACQFIKERYHKYCSWNTEEYELVFKTEGFIKDFKNHMKGE